ncbi:MAG: hypothetical protein KIG14_02785 [Candidatus Sacchiramonaceae bacterium]|nr:hypothetical protein [Candidatus Saccharimonadaceae bacterium]
MNSLRKNLNKWIIIEDQRLAQQRFYLLVAILSLLAASLIGLINYDLGQKILIITIASSGIFLVNAVAWALQKSFVENFFGVSTSTAKTVAKTTAKRTKK